MENRNEVDSHKLNLNSGKLFPKQFQFVGLLSVCAGMTLVFSFPVLSPFLIVIGFLLITSYSGIEFDTKNKTFREYNAFLFMKFGKFRPYVNVEKIYINESNMSQRVYSNSNTSAKARYIEYNSYLKFSNGYKLFLKSSKDKEQLMEVLRSAEQLFKLEIIDNTTEKA